MHIDVGAFLRTFSEYINQTTPAIRLIGTLFLTLAPALEPTNDRAASCADLRNRAADLIPGYPAQIYAANWYPNNSTFSTPEAIPEYSQPVPNLPEFCRFGAYFNTTSKTRVQFEVWLPINNWNNRFAFIGNGGDAGGVNYPNMGVPLAKYGLAVASTDTGHRGSGFDGTFAINNPETQIDFGHRAVHLSTIFAKNVVQAFYGKGAQKSYWLGCSSGGKQGLREITLYPEDYDGVLAGAPADWWSHLNAFVIEYNLRNQVGIAGHIDSSTWLTIHDQILSQCDALDGLKDNIITNPAICKPDFTKMGLSSQQAAVAASIYQNYTAPDGTLLFPTYSPGAEYAGPGFVTGSSLSISTDYFKYQVLNLTEISNRTFTSADLLKLLPKADATNPGLITVDDYNITAFIKRGGKLITYVGLADPLIPAQSTIYHHEKVRQTLGMDPRDSFRLFTVPGLGHCGGGIAPSDFGAAYQDPSTLSLPASPVPFDAKHNMILALINWTENGHAPDLVIGTKFNNDNQTQGIEFQRPLCPYPLMAKYNGGDANSANGFSCA